MSHRQDSWALTLSRRTTTSTRSSTLHEASSCHLHHFVQDSLVQYQFFAGPSGWLLQFRCSKIWCSNYSELLMLLQKIYGDSIELELLHNIYTPPWSLVSNKIILSILVEMKNWHEGRNVWTLRLPIANLSQIVKFSVFVKVLNWGLNPHEDQTAEMVLILHRNLVEVFIERAHIS